MSTEQEVRRVVKELVASGQVPKELEATVVTEMLEIIRDNSRPYA